MKKLLLKPGFEVIFSLSIIAILGIPPLVFGQDKKDLQITIINSDTTINGKNIKDLSAKERAEAIKDINRVSEDIVINVDGKKALKRKITVKRRGNANTWDGNIVIDGPTLGSLDTAIFADGNIRIFRDSLGKVFSLRKHNLRGLDSSLRVDLGELRFNNHDRVFSFNSPRVATIGFNRKNTQNFTYSNTDNEGISTRISFRVSEPSKETLKKIAGVETTSLEIKDLNIVPEFSSGKTIMMFNLPAKTNADVQLKDSDGKTLWSNKAATGSFSKSFSLPVNGVYYLVVKQGGKTEVKRIVKE